MKLMAERVIVALIKHLSCRNISYLLYKPETLKQIKPGCLEYFSCFNRQKYIFFVCVCVCVYQVVLMGEGVVCVLI